MRKTVEYVFLAGLLLTDQATKWWAQMHDLVILNAGGVFGLFPSVWWGVVLVVLWLILMWQWWKMPLDWTQFGTGIIVAGGLGNLVDRLVFGSVRDFIYYPGFRFYGNVADILLAVGVVVVIFSKIRQEKMLQFTNDD